MGPVESRDLLFASAGTLWGVVTAFRSIQEWKIQKSRSAYPAMVAAAAAIAITCLGYLVHRF